MGYLYHFYAAFHQVSKQVKGHVVLVKKTMHLTTFWHHLVEPLGDFFQIFRAVFNFGLSFNYSAFCSVQDQSVITETPFQSDGNTATVSL